MSSAELTPTTVSIGSAAVRSPAGFWRGFMASHAKLIGRSLLAVQAVMFVIYPTRPSADRLFIWLLLGSMAVGATKEGLLRFAPFVALIMVYESFRGIADDLNARVEVTGLIAVDRWLFGGEIPTVRLQGWLWHGQAGALELFLYSVYMLHFVLPFLLAFLLWRLRPQLYWPYASAIIVTSFAGFLTFLAVPAAPPWLAAENGYIDDFDHISAFAWERIAFFEAPTLYGNISPNPVAALPSLHAAYATLLAMFVFKAFGRRWGALATLYPVLIYFSTVYLGEHYLIDEIVGSLYAVMGMFLGRAIVSKLKAISDRRSTSTAEPVATLAQSP